MAYKIPLFALNYGKEELAAVTDVLRDGWISQGPRCAEFESEFARRLECKHAVTTDNCTNALHLALRLLNVGPGDEVLVPSLTFAATVNCVRYVGAEPVFCDIESPTDLCISPEDIRKKVTARTRAVIVMHYAGFPCCMDEIMSIASTHNLRVVEDACHSPLSVYKGRKLGTIGDVGCFSFFSNKNISTGEGGMLVTNDSAFHEKAKLLRSHGMTVSSYQRSQGHATKYDIVELGYNFRMDDIRAALGLAQLKKLESDLLRRAIVRRWYLDRLQQIEGIRVPFADHTGFVSNYIMTVLVSQGDAAHRESVREHLHSYGIQTSVHYPAVHRFAVYRDRRISLPKTEAASDSLISLPMFSQLAEADVEHIASSLSKAVAE